MMSQYTHVVRALFSDSLKIKNHYCVSYKEAYRLYCTLVVHCEKAVEVVIFDYDTCTIVNHYCQPGFHPHWKDSD